MLVKLTQPGGVPVYIDTSSVDTLVPLTGEATYVYTSAKGRLLIAGSIDEVAEQLGAGEAGTGTPLAIWSDGKLSGGQGFDAGEHLSTGVYSLTLSRVPGDVVPLVTVNEDAPHIATARYEGFGQVSVYITDNEGTPADADFSVAVLEVAEPGPETEPGQ